MEMTEPFATTVAAVAPVVLLAAALEISFYQRAVESSSNDIKQRLTEISEAVRAEGEVTEEHRRQMREWDSPLGPMARTLLVRGAIGMLWVLIMSLQAISTIVCVVWLSLPDQPKEWVSAGAIAFALGLGIATVTIFPVVRLLAAPKFPSDAEIEQMWEMLREPAQGGEAEASS
ncbi:hypothetical protein [Streptomyces lanatus]|uniref:Integral membrane protein n=1 Tax=Streptomyces lanatus TaxID=66900 RepID=A0ABV1Y5Z9_9ACTN|nr:hypothetical protein [Streptomyces lanatus]GHH29705.1 hypothetical protein GCM10018780_88160 [Streptomyces lanatus]